MVLVCDAYGGRKEAWGAVLPKQTTNTAELGYNTMILAARHYRDSMRACPAPTVVLGSNVAAAGHGLRAGLIVPSVAKLQLECLGTGRNGHELMAEADAKYGGVSREDFLQVLDGSAAHLWVARTVAQE